MLELLTHYAHERPCNTRQRGCCRPCTGFQYTSYVNICHINFVFIVYPAFFASNVSMCVSTYKEFSRATDASDALCMQRKHLLVHFGGCCGIVFTVLHLKQPQTVVRACSHDKRRKHRIERVHNDCNRSYQFIVPSCLQSTSLLMRAKFSNAHVRFRHP